tara:strand:- start:286 stop:627 length:342 start_codon:yes stop_codon:yes gene_type:complete
MSRKACTYIGSKVKIKDRKQTLYLQSKSDKLNKNWLSLNEIEKINQIPGIVVEREYEGAISNHWLGNRYLKYNNLKIFFPIIADYLWLQKQQVEFIEVKNGPSSSKTKKEKSS